MFRRMTNRYNQIVKAVRSKKDPDGFLVKEVSAEKGKGVFATNDFRKGDFLFQYKGEIVNKEPENKEYLFEFKDNGKWVWIDASEDDGSIGRFCNDDHLHPNAMAKKCNVDGPVIVFVAQRDIVAGDEIVFNYDSTNKETFEWRRAEQNSEKGQPAYPDDEIHSSGTEWKQDADESEYEDEDDDITGTECAKKKRLNKWLTEQHRRTMSGNIKRQTLKKKSIAPRKQFKGTVKIQKPDKKCVAPRKQFKGTVKIQKPDKKCVAPRKQFKRIVKRKRQDKKGVAPRKKIKATVQNIEVYSSDHEEQQEQQEQHEQQEQQEKQQSANKREKRQCDICGKNIFNLKRHTMQCHGIEQTKKTITSGKGYILRICCICHTIKERMGDHLQRVHKKIQMNEKSS